MDTFDWCGRPQSWSNAQLCWDLHPRPYRGIMSTTWFPHQLHLGQFWTHHSKSRQVQGFLSWIYSALRIWDYVWDTSMYQQSILTPKNLRLRSARPIRPLGFWVRVCCRRTSIRGVSCKLVCSVLMWSILQGCGGRALTAPSPLFAQECMRYVYIHDTCLTIHIIS